MEFSRHRSLRKNGMQLIWLVCTGLAHAQGTCQAPALGSPCARDGISSFSAAEPQLNLGIGNPIHLATGNKHQYEIDLPARPQDPLPALARYYNALDGRPGVLGTGWQLALDTHLSRHNQQWLITQADGSRIGFDLPGGPSVPSGSGSLQIHDAEHQWIWPDGTRLVFDPRGALIRQHSPGTLPIILTRHGEGPLAGAIQAISQGAQTIRMNYGLSGSHPTLNHADTPAGRFSYRYDHPPGSVHPRLISVTRPDGMQRHYLYESAWQSGNAYALTGLAVRTHDGVPVRLQSWFYDEQGRTITHIPGSPDSGAGRVDIEYLRAATPTQPGHTRVRQASEQISDFHFALMAGRYALLKVEGVPCPACAAPDTSARYDPHGRLLELNGTRIGRRRNGDIERVTPQASGWTGLSLHYDSPGRRHAWQSALTGLTQTHYDRQHRPVGLVYANGGTLSIRYDAMHRPVLLDARHHTRSISTRLGWRGRRLSTIHHPEENETRRYDARGRLLQRTVERPATGIRYAEAMAYDDDDRLVRHTLPEGGALLYEWGAGQQLLALSWQDPAGRLHPVIRHSPGLAGYRYGNGLHLSTHANMPGQTTSLLLRRDDTPLWLAQRNHDEHGRLIRLRDTLPEAGYHQDSRYGYDAASRLIGLHIHQHNQGKTSARQEWLAWSAEGALNARRSLLAPSLNEPSRSLSDIRRDPSGLPTGMDGFTLEYSPQRRLSAVSREGQTIATYTHNAFGHQIRRRTPSSTRELLYLNNRVVATMHDMGAETGQTKGDFPIQRRYLYVHETPVGFIDWRNPDDPQLFFIHADLLGAPRMVTDARQAMRWLADLSPGGHVQRIQGDLELDLRLPGQYHDAATGWHDNVFRTYDPQRMHYLEPDPLGPLPGQQALGYAAQQPGRYIDPLGLILMAFDGTRNDRQTHSNIWKLSQYYQDGPVFYHSGPGNEDYLDWDALTAWGAGQTLRTQWQSLMNALSQASRQNLSTPIDILGFSRGAALARHFANEIAQYTRDGWFSYQDPLRGTISLCVDLRFMGLFETVAQFGLLGINNSLYDLGISAAWQWVAHAVAAHERRLTFPLVSADPQAHHNTVEVPFIGAHADIGGGVLPHPDGPPAHRGDLSDVTLAWMLWQARAASVSFSELNSSDRTVSQAILHDERSTASRLLDTDRGIQDSRGLSTASRQGQHAQLGESQRQALERYIQRAEGWRLASGNEVGEVDMQGYAQWLESTLGLPSPSLGLD